jgi:hypothetical protein
MPCFHYQVVVNPLSHFVSVSLTQTMKPSSRTTPCDAAFPAILPHLLRWGLELVVRLYDTSNSATSINECLELNPIFGGNKSKRRIKL